MMIHWMCKNFKISRCTANLISEYFTIVKIFEPFKKNSNIFKKKEKLFIEQDDLCYIINY